MLLRKPPQVRPAAWVVPHVEQCLAQRMAHRLPGNHQVENAKDREDGDHEGKLSRIAALEAGEQAEGAGHNADREEIQWCVRAVFAALQPPTR
jgi:hypothetical protein